MKKKDKKTVAGGLIIFIVSIWLIVLGVWGYYMFW